MPERPRRVIVAGAGLAGLAAACAALEAGAHVQLIEATHAPGGATIDSAGWIWRYVDIEAYRRHAPHGDPAVQRLVVEQLDADLEWLARLGVEPLASSTGRALTRGVRVAPTRLIATLVALVGQGRIKLGHPLTTLQDVDADVVVLAGGGYAGDPARIAREAGLHESAVQSWTRRPRVANDGSTIDAALAFGARRSVADGQCLVRLAPRGIEAGPALTAAVSELHVPKSRLVLKDGTALERDVDDWSGAHQLRSFQLTGTTGYLELDLALLDTEVHSGRIGAIVADVARAGARVDATATCVRIAVQPGITHTWCGLDVDVDARVRLDRPCSVDLLAAGCDAAGTGLGGTASGLAQALVLGRRAGIVAARG